MNSTFCDRFVNIRNTIHQEGITTKDMLMKNHALYADFWLALQDFCHFALLSKTSAKNAQGEIRPGNTGKIDLLERYGVTTRKEIECDSMIRIISKLDKVLSQPIEKQKNYCYTIVNNIVNDQFRRHSPKDFRFVSFDEPVEGKSTTRDRVLTYADLLSDETYHPERILCEKETLLALRAELTLKQEQEQAEKKETILQEMSSLCTRPAEVMARLAVNHLGMKSRDVADLILDRGCKPAYDQILSDTARRNRISLDTLLHYMEGRELNPETVRAASRDRKVISDQVSRLVYRAEHHLHR